MRACRVPGKNEVELRGPEPGHARICEVSVLMAAGPVRDHRDEVPPRRRAQGVDDLLAGRVPGRAVVIP
jgi:hypothetical protein